jgi:hypothetical protein
MWSPTVIFDHDWHVDTIERRGSPNPCARCHQDTTQPMSEHTASACTTDGCHRDELALLRSGSRVAPEDSDRYRAAAGYMDAMHGLCVDCHKERAQELERPHHGDCATCHQERDAADIAELENRLTRQQLAAGGQT